VGAASIVEVEEVGQAAEAVLVRPVRPGVGPFVDERPDEPFGLAVGLGSPDPGPAVTDAELGEPGLVQPRAVARAVVGQDPLDRDPVAGEPADGDLDRPDRLALAGVAGDDDAGEPAMVVDEDLELIVARMLGTAAGPWPGPLAIADRDPGQRLRVLVNECTRVGRDVAAADRRPVRRSRPSSRLTR
jgi:hypothetical protein